MADKRGEMADKFFFEGYRTSKKERGWYKWRKLKKKIVSSRSSRKSKGNNRRGSGS